MSRHTDSDGSCPGGALRPGRLTAERRTCWILSLLYLSKFDTFQREFVSRTNERVSTTVNMTRKRNDVLILRGEKQEQTLESVHHPDTERERSPHSSLHLQNTLTPELCVRQTWSQYAKAVRVIPSPWKCLDVWQKQNGL